MFKKILCMILAIIMLTTGELSVLANAAAQEHAIAENNARWQEILDTPLSYDLPDYGPVEAFAEPMTEEESASPLPLDDTYRLSSALSEYKTDRFIIKYGQAPVLSGVQSAYGGGAVPLAASLSMTRSVDVVEAAEPLSLGKAVIETSDELTAAETLENLEDAGLVIVSIQPDFPVMAFSALPHDWPFEHTYTPENNPYGDTPEPYRMDANIYGAWETTKGNGAVVAVLDTGFDTSHPALSGRLLTGWDFFNDDSSVNDADWSYDQWHGTHIAGIIAANEGDDMSGVAPQAKIMPLKVFQGGVAYTSAIIEAISYAESHGARIANCSWGTSYENPALEEAVRDSSMLFVCAAGNGLQNADEHPVFPAAYRLSNVVSVAAVGPDGRLSRISNYGAETVDIAAPGEEIWGPSMNSGFAPNSGTSMAAAIASGASALVAAANPSMTASQMKEKLLGSACHVTGLDGKVNDGRLLDAGFALTGTGANGRVIEVEDPDFSGAAGPGNADSGQEFQLFNDNGVSDSPVLSRTNSSVSYNGLIYALKKTPDNAHGAIDIYDPQSNKVLLSKDIGYMTGCDSSAMVAANGKIFIFYSYGPHTSLPGWYTDLKIYDISSGNCQALVGINGQGYIRSAVSDSQGRIYVLLSNGFYEFDPDQQPSGRWTPKSTPPGCFNMICDGRYLFAFSENAIYRYDTENAGSVWENFDSSTSCSGAHSIFKDSILSARIKYKGNMPYLEVFQYFKRTKLWIKRYEDTLPYSDALPYGSAMVWQSVPALELSGKLYINAYSNSLLSYSKVFDTGWRDVTGSGIPGEAYGKTASFNDTIYAFTSEGTDTREVRAFDAFSGSWFAPTSLPSALGSLTEFEVVENMGKFYVLGGKSEGISSKLVYEYNIAQDTWSAKASMGTARRLSHKAVAADGKIFVAGGQGQLTSFERYDIQSNAWQTLAPLPASVTAIYGLCRAEGKIIAIASPGILEYDPSANSWRELRSFGLTGVKAVVKSEYYDFFSIITDTEIYQYDPSANTLQQNCVSPLPEKNYLINSARGRLYFIDKASTDIYEYNQSLSWSGIISQMPHPAEVSDTLVVGKDVYVFGGGYMQKLNTETEVWSDLGAAPYPDTEAFYDGGKIYCFEKYKYPLFGFGDTNYKIYDIGAGTWQTKSLIRPYASERPYVLAVANGILYYLFLQTTTSSSSIILNAYNLDTMTLVGSKTWGKNDYYIYNCKNVEVVGDTIYVYSEFYRYYGSSYGRGNSYHSSNSLQGVVITIDADINNLNSVASISLPHACFDYGMCSNGQSLYFAGGSYPYNTYINNSKNHNYNSYLFAPLKYALKMDRLGNAGVISNIKYLPELMEARSNPGAAVVDGKLYVMGGKGNSGAATSSVEVSDVGYMENDELHYGEEEINPSGNFSRTYTDMVIDVPGFKMNLTRTYNSKDTEFPLDLFYGRGWSFGFQSMISINTAISRQYSIKLPDGSVQTFKIINNEYVAQNSRSTLISTDGQNFVLTTKDQYRYYYGGMRSYEYSGNGNLYAAFLTRMEDPNGNYIKINYDSATAYSNRVKLTSVVSSSGAAFTFTYGSYNQSLTVKDGLGREVKYTFSNQALESVTLPDGSVTKYSYTPYKIYYKEGDIYFNSTPQLSKIETKSSADAQTSQIVEEILYTFIPEDWCVDPHYDQPNPGAKPKVSSITDQNGLVESYSYDTTSRSVKKSAGGKITTTYFDRSLYPIRVIDPDGKLTVTQYYHHSGSNRYGEPRSVTDRNGNTTFYDRDAAGNVTRVINPDGSAKSYVYGDSVNPNRVTKETDELGNATYYQYDSSGNLTLKARRKAGTQDYSAAATQSNFEITTYEYGQKLTNQANVYIKGLLMCENLPGGGKTEYEYDAYGYLNTKKTYHTASIFNTETYGYNAIGWLISKKDGKNNETKFFYDKDGRILKTIYPDGGVERNVYDFRGNLIKKVSPKYYSATYDSAVFNTTTNIVSSAAWDYSAAVSTQRYVYNTNGTLASDTNPAGYTTDYNSYDVYGNLKQKTMPNGAVYLYDYDVLDRLVKEKFKDSASGAEKLLAEHSYSIIGGNTVQTDKRFTSATASTDTKYTHDWAGRLIRQDNPDGGILTNEYYANGLLKASKDARGFTSLYVYDALGRITEKRAPTVSGSVYALTKYEYNAAGLISKESRYIADQSLTSATGSAVVTESFYDDAGRLTKKTDNAGRQTEYLYDAAGNMKQEKAWIDGTGASARYKITDFDYNSMNLVWKKFQYLEMRDITPGSSSTDSVTLETSYTYDKNGNLETEKNPNGVTTTYACDALNRQTGKSYQNTDENGADATVTSSQTYNEMGNVATKTDERGKVTSFGYDKRGNLTSTTYPDGGVETREYDLAGRLSKLTSPANPGRLTLNGEASHTHYLYDEMDRLRITYYGRAEQITIDAVSTVITVYTYAEVLDYDKNGNVVKRMNAPGSISDNSRTTTYTYDAGGRLTKTTHPASIGKWNSSEYDALGRVAKSTNENGVATAYTYDNAGNMLTTTVAGTLMLTNTYDKLGNVLTSKDANGKSTMNYYNKLGLLRTSILPSDINIAALINTYCYDKLGKVTNTRDIMNRERIFTYDNVGRVLTSTEQKVGGAALTGNDAPITTATKYDVAGNPIYVYDGNNVSGGYIDKTTYSYDDMNRVLTVKNPKGQILTYAYDKNGNKLSEENWRGNKFEFVYDDRDRLVERKDPFGKIIEKLDYDNANRQTKSLRLNSDGVTFDTKQFFYDALGRLTSTKDEEGCTVSQTYDGLGNVLTKTDGNNKVTNFEYDSLGRLKKVTNPDDTPENPNDNTTVEYTYDNMGNMLTQKTSGRLDCTMTYNARGLMLTRKDAANLTESYDHNQDGTLKSKTDRNGAVTGYVYDIHGRPVLESAGCTITGLVISGGEAVSYTYDKNGNQLTMTDSTGTTTRSYDTLNRVLTKASPGFSVTTFTYDIADGTNGAIAEKSTNGSLVTTKVFDKAGRLSEVRDGAHTTSYAYFDNGSLKELTYPGSLTEEYVYYKNGKLKTLANKRGTVILDAYAYAYDGAGNMLLKIDGLGTTGYEYTDLNQLKTVTEPDGKVTSYVYDEYGNRKTETITKTGSNTITTACTYNSQNRLTKTVRTWGESELATTYGYDPNGNMLSRVPELMEARNASMSASFSLFAPDDALKTGVYVYDKRNQMIEATLGGETIENVYNGEGLRVKKISALKSWQYLYEYDKIVLEKETEGSTVTVSRNVHGTNLISRDAGGSKAFYMYNGHHDTVRLVTAAGTTVAAYYYDAFGQIVTNTDADGSGANAKNPYLYSGYFFDAETTLYYLKSRFYDAGLARFMQEDTYWNTHNSFGNGPVPDTNSMMQSLNRYAYCVNNPLIYHDPTGYAAELNATGKVYVQQLEYLKKSNPSLAAQCDKEIASAKSIGGNGVTPPSSNSSQPSSITGSGKTTATNISVSVNGTAYTGSKTDNGSITLNGTDQKNVINQLGLGKRYDNLKTLSLWDLLVLSGNLQTTSYWKETNDISGEATQYVVVNTDMKNAPIQVVRHDNNMTIDAYVNIYGDGADMPISGYSDKYVPTKATEGIGTTYRDAVIWGIEKYWSRDPNSSTYNMVDANNNPTNIKIAYDMSVTVNVHDINHGRVENPNPYTEKQYVSETGQRYMNVIIHNGNGGSTGNLFDSNLPVGNQGNMHIWTGQNLDARKFDPQIFAKTAAHEFGHELGIKDGYRKERENINMEDAERFDSFMNNYANLDYAQPIDYEMIMYVLKTNHTLPPAYARKIMPQYVSFDSVRDTTTNYPNK